jgi:hypothetical protein
MAAKEKDVANFRGWHFPEDPDFIWSDFIRADEKNRLKNMGAFAGTVFASIAWFDGATFSEMASFAGATFSGMASFDGATFSGTAWFIGATFSGVVLFEGATFSGKASFENATFSRVASFNSAMFSGSASFLGATFSDLALFGDATFSRTALFDGARFSGTAAFNGATFSRRASFDGTTFSEQASFDGAVCNPAMAFFDHPARRCGLKGPKGKRSSWRAVYILGWAVVRDAATFAAFCLGRNHSAVRAVFRAMSRWPSFLAGRPHPFRLRWGGETAYRLAKQSAQGAGDYSQAGGYHYAEQCAIEDKWRNQSGLRPWRRAFWLWLGRLVFGRIVFGYGERPLNPLLLGLGVILLCSGLYAGLDAVAPGHMVNAAAVEAYRCDFTEALYFSAVTFTTLGYGDCAPKPAYRFLAASEAVLGAALMAVFVVCLTRKYMR